ncbi:predicted protein [Nematostella vectensis]|uniref:Uncharacterized protein n=1 Tax=Nematostella vectensis TaxID=45351 RepID=A7TD01_NEMVE|nr:predicted protein [Nematostella vectensis]|eukprot:XP_001618157.1 hypothetical protein NEMVEDRAFT_v1g225452 [Nematostella vectensis]
MALSGVAAIQSSTPSQNYSITLLSPPVYTPTYSYHPNLDTRGLHTLAELCLRRADYNPALRSTDSASQVTDTAGSGYVSTGVKREHDYSPLESGGEAYVDERDEEKIIDVVGEETKETASGKAKNARLERLDDELEKMLQ